ncbi:GntR family transcriptional regulator [Ruminiclostridium cellobioparum]|uniref:Transcriptional regulator n=1 Tax=Ruminiclostridium cellobioparum subsp. termitidis CT1112 TaxID=1195236 RepID=S0FKA7_RUMCE|nr:GntR family transcriptional regulator [Ruminiclostridium cellobioparum]EMS70756.1 transcriptional regulator [Ruminiclostridium cellobioparum subsp. termitidis CT1112]
MFIDKKSPVPAYFQLKNIILDKIKSGEYPAGSLIPSERELSESLGISRMTARQAINQLAAENYLVREKGKGTFVNKIKFEQRNIMSFSETVKRLGMVPKTRVLEFSEEKEYYDVKLALDLKPEQKLYRIKRLRLADDTPIAVEEVFIPEGLCPDINRLDLTKSLYDQLKNIYSIEISHIDNNIEAIKADRENRKLLMLEAGIPVLNISGISYTREGRKLFFERDVYRADKYKYSVRIYMNHE